MRILHVIDGLGCGGAERLLTGLLPGLIERGVEPVVFALSKEAAFFLPDLEEAGITVKFSRVNRQYSLLQIKAIREEIAENKYDLVHVHLFPAQLWCSIASSGMKIPLVTTEHSTSNRRRNKLLFRLIDSFIYSKMERIICISNATKANLCNWVPRICERAIVIFNGIDVRRFSEAVPYEKRQLVPELAENSKLILMVSRFSHQKDHGTVVRALTLLPEEFHVVFVGDGDRIESVKQLAQVLKLKHRVHFLGRRDDVPRIMKTADVLVQSSHWEGFGLTVVEGVASGLPVLASDVPGLNEVISDKDSLFSPGNFRELADKLLSLKDFRFKLSEETFSREILGKFALNSVTDKYVEVYKAVLASYSALYR